MVYLHAIKIVVVNERENVIEKLRKWDDHRLRFARLDRLSKLAACAALKVLGENRIDAVSDRRAVVFGSAYGCHEANECYFDDMIDDEHRAGSPALFVYTLPSAPAAALSVHFEIHGPIATLTQGLGSGIAALAQGAQWLRARRADWVLCGAGDVSSRTLRCAYASILDEKQASLDDICVMGVLTRDPCTHASIQLLGFGQAYGPNAIERAEQLACIAAKLDPSTVQHRIVCDASSTKNASLFVQCGMAFGPLLQINELLDDTSRRDQPTILTTIDRSGLVDTVLVK